MIGLPPGSRIVLEKPFGDDLDSAAALNRLLRRAVGDAGEQAVYRVDHVLALSTVQNLLALRLFNRTLEPVWNSVHIEQVDLLWEEDLGLEDRAAYYDRAGALRDVIQNHLLQVLCLVAMETPTSLQQHDLRDGKVEVLRAVRRLTEQESAVRTRRARYAAGRLAHSAGGHAVPAYVDEDGVDAERGTETFAEMMLELDNERWAGTRFRLRAGKALQSRRKQVVIRFRPTAYGQTSLDTESGTNELRIGLDGPTDVALRLTGGVPYAPPEPAPFTLAGPPPTADIPPYGRLLLDILAGGHTFSVRGDEAEEAWRVVTPVLRG
jgi:glucose-6-phosphate 1-dehydrogenase